LLTIVSAMEEELAPVRAALSAHDQGESDVAAPPLSFQVLGIGREGVEPGLKALLRTLRQRWDPAESPSGLLLLGFAGGVDPSLSPGDLALAGRYCHLRSLGERLVRVPDGVPLEEFRQRMMAEAEASDPNLPRRAVLKFEEFRQRMWAGWQTRDRALPSRADLKSLQPDPGMWQRAKDALSQASLTAVEADSMTVDHVVAAPNTKAELHRQYQVGTVNMEDYWVARLAAAAKVPFLSVRAVLDTAGQVLPRWVTGLSGRPGWAAMNILSRPWQAPSLFELARQKRLAEASLVRFALAFAGYRQGAAPSPPAAA
jgi:nucleoside phosphorylase